MTPEEIDRILIGAANRAMAHPDPAVIEVAKSAIPETVSPARALPAPWLFVLALLGVFAVVSVFGASALGVRGLPVLNAARRAVIFPVLLAAAAMAAIATVHEMRPAGGRRLGPITLAASVTSLLATFGLLFHNYDAGNFVVEGLRCLAAGLACAAPAGFAISLFLRRGFVLDWRAAGIAAGTLAGLAGICMLEIHCPILNAPHIMCWHVAVAPASTVSGLFIGWIAQARHVKAVRIRQNPA
jgi:hypothetical protein